MSVTLRDKFYGCICGAHIGSSMGAVVEGWNYQRIEATYGVLDNLYPYEHYNNGWLRAAGTTEDGIDRQKLMITAIIEKGGRVSAEDVRKIWVRDIQPGAPGGICEPFEGELLKIAKTVVPARELGRFCDYSGLNSFSRACHPIGLINAGDIEGAIDDVLEVGQLYQTTNSRGLKWACVTAVAIAAATKPDATLDSVLQAIFNNLDERQRVDARDDGWYADYAGLNIVDEIKGALDYTKDCRDYKDLREAFQERYNGIGMPYNISYANEVVTKGICVFKTVNANLKQAIITAVNLGRDTDCVAAVAAGISGALDGTRSLPEEWIKQVDYATSIHRFTNNKRTLREHADGLYGAYKNHLKKLTAYADLMSY
ncbi:MAG: ADP-ribosylglycohydrolase family protein [Clostridiales bacterium]|jgi:ADP-ribosylglycohydrolase|nr:ADP-ribosylglycohydrolase family protein [Clostridiales bacterium]